MGMPLDCSTCTYFSKKGLTERCGFIRTRPTGMEHHMRQVVTQVWFESYEEDCLDGGTQKDCPEHVAIVPPTKLTLITQDLP